MQKICHHIAEPNFQNGWIWLWYDCFSSWCKQFKTFEHKLWDLSDLDVFVQRTYPEYYNVYKNLPHNISKIDVAKILLLHHYGGIYCDMDLFCHKNFEHLLQQKLYLVEEADKIFVEKNNTFLKLSTKFSNFLMVSREKNNQIWITIVESMFQKIKHLPYYNYNKEKYVLSTTGPVAIEEILVEKNLLKEFDVLPCRLFNRVDGDNGEAISDAYTTHLNISMWMKPEKKDVFDSGGEDKIIGDYV